MTAAKPQAIAALILCASVFGACAPTMSIPNDPTYIPATVLMIPLAMNMAVIARLFNNDGLARSFSTMQEVQAAIIEEATF